MSFAKRKLLANRIKIYSILFGLVFFSIYLIYTGTAGIVSTGSWRKITSVSFVAGIIFGVLLAHFNIWYRKKLDKTLNGLVKKIKSAKLGIEGENKVGDELHKILDDKIFYIKNDFKFGNKKFDIDFLIIGPKGIILLEVKNYTNKLKFFDNSVSYVNGGVEYPSYKDPRAALLDYADYLNDYLNKKGFDNLLVSKAVVIPDESKVEIDAEKTGIYIIQGVGRIAEYLSQLKAVPRYDATFCHQLVEALDEK